MSAAPGQPSSLPVTPARCHTCEQPTATPLYCPNCREVLPADDFDFFALLGLPRSFDLDNATLRRHYLDAARLTHPDRFPGSSTDVADRAMRASAQLNRAQQVLGDPISRAEYLLELAGGQSAADDKTVPPEVLAETLMLREEIEEAGGDERVRGSLRGQVQSQRDARLTRIADLARKLPADEDLRRALRVELNAIKYYQRMMEQL